MLFLTTSKRFKLWVLILSPREGLFLLILRPLPRGFEWFLFVTKGYPRSRPTEKQGLLWHLKWPNFWAT